MKAIYRYILLALCSALTANINAQEELYPLRYSESQRQQNKTAPNEQFSSRDIERTPFVYVIDTIDIPFFDDFTKDKIKVYDAQKTDDNISLRILYDFTVQDDINVTKEFPPNLEVMFEPTHSIYRYVNGSIDSTENPLLYITFYNEVGEEVGYDTAWTNIVTEFDEGAGLVSYDTIEAETTFVNTYDTLYVVADNNSLWTTPADEFGRGGPHINNTFGANILTQGVASFDGTDALGWPYNIESETSYGSADTLESKPINLQPEMTDVFLSFFYQMGGMCNEPEEEDSLLVEFYDVTNEQWNIVWSRQGQLDEPDEWSSQVWLRVKGAEYLQPGFKFRFRNFATLSAQMDIWNIDYIRLDENRDSTETDTVSDVSLITPLSTFTKPYTAVPYSHYLEDYAALQSDTVFLDVRNLGYSAVNVLSLEYTVTDRNDSIIQSFASPFPNLSARTLQPYAIIQPTTQIFPNEGTDAATYYTKAWYRISGGNDEFINDTIYSKQEFVNYYSYDDGSAEQAYSLTGVGLELAYGFTAPIGDSLRGILINFPQVLKDNSEDQEFELLIWNDTGSNPIYTSSLAFPPIHSGANEFARYNLEAPVYVEGQFYIGYRQLEAGKLYVGFDKNTNSRNSLFYRDGNNWFQSSFNGSLLMRPDFGIDPTLSTNDIMYSPSEFDMYPNPANNEVMFTSKDESLTIKIYTISGQMINTFDLEQSHRLSINRYTPGVYLVRAISGNSGAVHTKKLIVTE